MNLPPMCPEIPVVRLPEALAHYRDQLGFTIDWADESIGLAQLSFGGTRAFMADAGFRTMLGNPAPIVLWLNLDGRDEIDALHAQWAGAGANIISPPEAKPHKLYEYFARDLDGNIFRVFYDFGWEDSGG